MACSRASAFICVHASMSVSMRLRSRPCLYVRVRVRESAFVCVHIIKRPDASGCIDNDASGRVFHSRTFEMHYMYVIMHVLYETLLVHGHTCGYVPKKGVGCGCMPVCDRSNFESGP